MINSVHSQSGWRKTIKILTVDTSKRYVEGIAPEGARVRAMVIETGAAFRWPAEGEFWIVQSQQNNWRLAGPLENKQTTFPIEKLPAGATKIPSTQIFDASGNNLLSVPLSGAVSGALPVFSSSTGGWTPQNVGFVTGDYKQSFLSADHTGWLKTDGRLVSRTTYAALFALVGTTFNVGDGSTTFGLPTWQPDTQATTFIKT